MAAPAAPPGDIAGANGANCNRVGDDSAGTGAAPVAAEVTGDAVDVATLVVDERGRSTRGRATDTGDVLPFVLLLPRLRSILKLLEPLPLSKLLMISLPFNFRLLTLPWLKPSSLFALEPLCRMRTRCELVEKTERTFFQPRLKKLLSTTQAKPLVQSPGAAAYPHHGVSYVPATKACAP